MPTPRPIMVARVGETVAKVNAAASSPRQASPPITLISAVSSGMPAASTLPKPTSRTTIATANPISSLIRSSAAGRASSPSGPPYSTCTPADRSGFTDSSTPWR
ncbi:hypothetical protein QFZ49_008196 [Streptomyces turgidiscabies]|uniref:Uncharacterized protein n=1 Tax=Streptomyces turgidiscabies TaxID=85558 RepID=A0ABU0S1T5_9ACTN|nr:hypothetical protein [Streptomyces turgidiscabies]